MPKNKTSAFGTKLLKRAEAVRDFYVEKDSTKVRVKRLSKFEFIPRPNYDADDIKNIRAKSQLTQEALADLMGTSIDTVRKWEQNVSQPTGPALRLLQMLEAEGIPKILIANA